MYYLIIKKENRQALQFFDVEIDKTGMTFVVNSVIPEVERHYFVVNKLVLWNFDGAIMKRAL